MENNKKPDAENLLQVCDIYKSFGDNAVLKGMTLSLASGEVLSLIGGNGAGKSTLMKIIMGIYTHDSGKVIVNGKENETIEYGDTYTEEGASASYNTLSFKNKSVDVSISGEVDCSKLGTYHIHYKAKKGFLSSTKTREVKVVDTAAPVIELNTVEGYYPKTGEAYKEEGFTATDNYDGDITDKVTRHEKDNVVTYTVSDSSGNKTTVTRTVEYNDGIAPSLTLNGDSHVTIKAGTKYKDTGAAATDSHGNDISDSITVSGEVKNYRSGDYTLTYTATDKFGNTNSIDRTVTVEAVKQADSAAVNPGSKVVYLTFDDGPGAYTQQLLDVLAKYNIKVTFFCNQCKQRISEYDCEGSRCRTYSCNTQCFP